MSTQGLFSFVAGNETFNVLTTQGGSYPKAAVRKLQKTLPLAWPPPLFEPGEFAAAFVAGNKMGPGEVRILSNDDALQAVFGSVAYRYVIEYAGIELFVTCFGHPAGVELFAGSVDKFLKWAKIYDGRS